jgi:uncharacterized protein with NAD-binding domain and iron-sulfur cluster
MGEKVAVLGAGVAGMTAAHELAERGFEVHVYERRAIPGGKARSFSTPSGLPAEHGFRFFPGFYKHLHHTMRRIPYQGARRGVLSNLKPARDILMLQHPGKRVYYPTHLWSRNTVWLRSIKFRTSHFFTANLGLSHDDVIFLGGRLRTLLMACVERRFAEFELQDWWYFSQAEMRSPQYRKVLCGLTRSLVAARAEELSVRTCGYILLQLQLAGLHLRGHLPRVLNGPTNTVWIDPWHRHLERLGVHFHFGQTVKNIRCVDKYIHEVIVADDDGASSVVHARWYVAALPVEIMQTLATPAMVSADQRLATLAELRVRWMNGVMFYLRKDMPIVHGHIIYLDSPWALTSISQKQFWGGFELGSLGGVKVSGVLSVDVSDWDSNGVVYGKPAKLCTKVEIEHEVLAQIRDHLAETPWAHDLDDDNIVDSFVDEDIVWPNFGGAVVNLEPLLINTPGSWTHRPEAVTKIENLFLASDYIQTYTDLATMEGANEAARRAVNGILERSGSTQPRCDVWPLHDPGGPFAWGRRVDRSRLMRADRTAFEQAANLIAQLAGRPAKHKP